MANEIRATATLQVTKDGFTITGNSTATISMTGSNYKGEVMTIGTSYVPLPTGSCADTRYMFLYNQSTASLDVAVNTASQSFCTLQRADVMVMPPTQAQLYIKSSLDASDVQFVLVES